MFDIFWEEKLIAGLMLGCLAFSIFCRIFLGLLYQNMIREADNMATTDNKILKQCKLKFANCYQLSNGVANIPVFVDKFLNRLSFGHMSFGVMYHLSGQAMLLSVVFSGVGICKCIARGRSLMDVLPFYIVSLLGLYLYFNVSAITDIKGKKRILKVNLVDYLENHLSPRMNVTRRDLEMLYGDEISGERENADAAAYGAGSRASARRNRKEKRSPESVALSAETRLGVTESRLSAAETRLGVTESRLSAAENKLGTTANRLSPEEKRDLFAVAQKFAETRKDPVNERAVREDDDSEQEPAPVGEELETLLREFLAL